MSKKKIGIIGYGNMGSAIAERIKSAYEVIVFDKDISKTKNLSDIKVATDTIDLAKRADVFVLAVKPQDFEGLLKEIKDYAKDKLIISIAAGITTSYIETRLNKARVVRVMPNLPARIGKGVSCLCKGRFSKENDIKLALRLFKLIGEVLVLSENMMDAATAISGSGPGFWSQAVENRPKREWKEYSKKTLIPEFSSAAISVGFNAKQARFLAEKTVWASFDTVNAWHIKPEEFKKLVASKGGTTEAGLKKLKRGGTLLDAVRAAIQRAKRLSLR
jgi:pyrroline-5-carboxylate reductase